MPGSAFRCRLDGATFAACTSPKSYNDLALGTHTFAVRATDFSGNTGPTATRTWTISNDFTFGKVKKNKRKGTAKLTVNVPGSGELDLAKTKKVKGAEKGTTAEEGVKLPVKPRGEAKRKLNKKGKAKVKAEVTFTPDGGTPNTQGKKIELVKR